MSTSISTSKQPVLYSSWRSSCAWRVRIALQLKEIPYIMKPVALKNLGAKGHTDEFREINPLEKVPALQIGMFIKRIACTN